ncbi:MAG: thermonuclease family protein [Actinomycetota bacterium]|nr:thermonuclease family protein [Actinomycetota bacterium]
MTFRKIINKSYLIIVLSVIFLSIFSGCGLYYDYGKADNSDGIEDESGILVKEVVDGDTIVLSNGSRVRLIGINTPEHGMYFFEEAKEVLEAIVLGKEIVLEKDISNKDKYGRLLRYVYAGDLFVNLEMVKRGFANAYTYPPDVEHNEEFLEAERYARENNLGLWLKSKVDIVKVEVNYDARGNDNNNLNDEYVKMENTGDDSIDIGGWTIKDAGTNIYRFEKYFFESGSEVFLFTGSGRDGAGKFYWGSSGPIWNNDSDTLYLRDKEGLLVEIYNY